MVAASFEVAQQSRQPLRVGGWPALRVNREKKTLSVVDDDDYDNDDGLWAQAKLAKLSSGTSR